MIQNLLFIIFLFVVQFLLIALIRAKSRLEHIKKYHYDYYDNHPNDFDRRLWHNFKHVMVEATTIVPALLLTAVESYVFVF